MVDNSTALVQQKSVVALADRELLDVVRQHRIQPRACTGSDNAKLAHVRDIEDPDIVSDRLMFLDDAAVLHWHQPASERHHLRAAFYMLVVKRRFLRRGVGHARSLDFAIRLRNAAAR